ncbi:MAG: peptide deformylase [Candidatus Cloacimonetes bacterium 4572_55]|nr:MAG: peptide deformylase [Candidatus Cloacimonetes bacterium 4572_55]
MALLPIVYYGDRILRKAGKRIDPTDLKESASIKKLAHDMIETMRENNGIGLAAQQVNRLERIIMIDVSSFDENAEPFALINPEIVKVGKEKVVIQEGCLSFPDLYLDIERPALVTVAALDIEGNPMTLEADGILARALQHEIDHMKGTLFIDYIHPLKRKFLLKKWQVSSNARKKSDG